MNFLAEYKLEGGFGVGVRSRKDDLPLTRCQTPQGGLRWWGQASLHERALTRGQAPQRGGEFVGFTQKFLYTVGAGLIESGISLLRVGD